MRSEGGKVFQGVTEFLVNIFHFLEDAGEEGAIAGGDSLNELIRAPAVDIHWMCAFRVAALLPEIPAVAVPIAAGEAP